MTAAFFIVRYFSAESFSLPSLASVSSMWVETPAIAPQIKQELPRGSHAVAAAGPSSPSAAAPPTMPPVMSAPPEPTDPYDDTQESADAPEQLRFPERSFGPGIVPETSELAKAGGIAGPPAASAQAFQQFNPEFVSNGGGFFDNISAHENENPNYSAF